MSALAIFIVFIVAIILFWFLIFRVIAALIKLDPYHPLTQWLFSFTDIYVKPFRTGFFRREATIDPAVIPPLMILLVIIILSGFNL